MTVGVQIFVGGGSSLTDFAKDLEQLLGAKFAFVPGHEADSTARYELWTDRIHVSVQEADHFVTEFPAELDLNVSDYQQVVTVNLVMCLDGEDCTQPRNGYARYIFTKLQTIQRYRLLLVYEMAVKIDEFVPLFNLPLSLSRRRRQR